MTTQYLIAQWDYAAEGEFELSFRQGDRIKLLEKHNDDWWEGELNNVIGFFPANRTILEQPNHSFSNDNPPVTNDTATTVMKEPTSPPPLISITPPIQHKELNNNNNTTTTLQELPPGWAYAYDQEGTIYYFNEDTGESRWEVPTTNNKQLSQQQQDHPVPLPPRTSSNQTALSSQHTTTTTPSTIFPLEDTDLDATFNQFDPEVMKKLSLDHLESESIRYQGYIQMKMVSDNVKLSSWKMYYAVLLRGYLLFYKEAHVKHRKKLIPPVGSFDLDDCQIDTAGKQDTKRKHCFMITIPPPRQKVTLYIQTAKDKECAAWLDAIMRELVLRKEGNHQDSDILQLLRTLTLDDSQMKVNKKMTKSTDGEMKEQKGKTKYDTISTVDGRGNKKHGWFSGNKSNRNDSLRPQHSNNNNEQQQQQSTSPNKTDIFGGYLRLDDHLEVPLIVRQCIQQVDERGLESVGIYRLSGPASTIQKYRSAYNRHEMVDLTEEHDINVATGLLKLYFRELQNPLMTFEYYDWFIDAARIPDYDDRMYQIKSIIHALPLENFKTLEYLMRHLNRVSLYSEINKMETSNLALIFSVGLLRTTQDDLSSIIHTDLQSKIIEAIIQQVDWFFEMDDDDDDDDDNEEIVEEKEKE
ncbi:unnamed protein product [Cunninghamella echinulata]